ncbi:MAG: hypothetical protein M3Q97_01845, partial [Bacteroidota bacterium]|nr:hypothetical protein [Bacteroidota bacterium]
IMINGKWVLCRAAAQDSAKSLSLCDYTGPVRIAFQNTVTGCVAYSATDSIALKDNTAPAKPDIHAIIHHASWSTYPYVYLYAYISPDGSKPGRAILSRQKNGGSWQVIDTVQANITGAQSNLYYYDSTSNKQVGDHFCYRMQSIDSCGNLSSVEEKCMPFLTVTPGNNRMNLKVDNMTNTGSISIRYYYWYRRKSTETSYKLLGNTFNKNTYVDTSVNCHDTYNYYVYEYASAGSGNKYLGYSNFVEDVSFDTVSPDAPVIRYATVASGTSNQLVFNKSVDTDLKRYLIYASKNGGGFSKADSVQSNGSSTYTWTHSGIVPQSDTWCYYILAVDSCNNNISSPSDTHCVINLAASINYTSYDADLNWSAYKGDDVRKYIIEKYISGAWQAIDSVASTATAYTDTALDCSVVSGYRIKARLYTRYSYISVSDTERINSMKVLPPPALDCVAYDSSGNVILNWSLPADTTNFGYYLVFRSASPIDSLSPGTAIDTIFTSSVTLFSDISAGSGPMYYALQTVNDCGEAGLFSASRRSLRLTYTLPDNVTIKLSWDKPGTSTHTYYIETNEGEGWKALSSTNDTSYTWSRCSFDGRFRIYSVDGTTGCKSHTNEIRTQWKDTIAPDVPALHYATVLTSTANRLYFNKSAAADLGHYFIYGARNGGSFTLLDSIQSTGSASYTWTHQAINTQTDSWCYYIQAGDTCPGNISLPTATHCAINLTAEAKNQEAGLTWTAYAGKSVETYFIQRMVNGLWTTLDSVSASTPAYTDTALECNKTYYYRILARLQGNSVTASDTTPVTPFDTIKPAQVNILSASVMGGSTVALSFMTVADKDVNRYDIYSSRNGGAFSLAYSLYRPSKGIVTFLHNGLNTLSDYYSYRIIAVDSCVNNQSATTETHTTIQTGGSAGNYQNSLSWTAYEGFTVRSYALQTLAGGTWVDLKTFGPSVFTYTHDSLLCNETRYYRVHAWEDGGDNRSVLSDTVALTPFDTITPAMPALNYVSVLNDNTIEVGWQKSASADVKNYIISRKSSTGSLQVLDTLGDVDIFRDTTINATSASYCYSLQAMDSCAENTSAATPLHCSIRLLTAISGCEKSIYLDWNGYTGWDSVKKYELYRNVDGGGESLLVTLAGSATSFKDTLLDYNSVYCYRIKAYEEGSVHSSWSGDSCNRTFFVDTPYMVAVTKMNSSSTAGQTLVKWNKITRPYMSHYRLYYATAPGSFSVLENALPIEADSFIHTGINTRYGEHYYYLESLDSCGGVSAKSATHKTMDLEVTIGQLIHNLNWTAYSGFAVQHYEIQRWDGTKFNNVDTVPASDTLSVQFPAPCNYTIHYRIAALSNSGHISYSDTMGKIAIDTVLANAPGIHNVTILSGSASEIKFRGSDSLDVYAYYIMRSVDGAWATAGQILFTTPGDSHVFTYNRNTTTEQLCYAVISVDSCLNATSSDTFCAIQLKGTDLNLATALAWHPFAGYSISAYRVLHHNGTGWDTLATLGASDTSYVHTPLSCNISHTYKIHGVEQGGLRHTVSDSITLIPFDTVGPPAPVISYTTVLNGTTTFLDWQKVPDADVRNYEVRIRSSGGTWVANDTVRDITEYTFTGLNTLDSVYCFSLVAMDSCSDNRSEPAAPHCPIQLKGSPQNLSNLLQWNDYEGFSPSEYIIYRWNAGAWT